MADANQSPPSSPCVSQTKPEQNSTTQSASNMDICIYINATIITMNPSRDVIVDGAIVVRGDKILAVMPSNEMQDVMNVVLSDYTMIDLKGKIILPGLINTHAHLGQSLIRGLAEDLNLHEWLCEAVWKLEDKYEKDDGYVAASLTIAEMLKSGTTCFLESMLTAQSGIDNVVRAVGDSGIRACLGKLIKTKANPKTSGIVDQRGEKQSIPEISNGGNPSSCDIDGTIDASTSVDVKLNGNAHNSTTPPKEDSNVLPHRSKATNEDSAPTFSENSNDDAENKVTREALKDTPADQKSKVAKAPTEKQIGNPDEMTINAMIDSHQRYDRVFNDRVRIWAAATTPRGSPLSCHNKIGAICREYDFPFTMHCAESPRDLTQFKTSYNHSPMQFCHETKLLSPKTVLAHMVNLNLPVDLPLLASYGTTVAHCPNSNLKLGSGVANIPEMLKAGVNVSLGTDGAPCGNTYDMFREIHLAGILHKGVNNDASLVNAMRVLEMATVNGARALGLQKSIGSLEMNKKADFIVIDPSGIHCAPYDQNEIANGGLDPVTLVVHTCTGRDVEMVVVDGLILVRDGKLVHQDEGKIIKEARLSIKGIRSRADVRLKTGRSSKGTIKV